VEAEIMLTNWGANWGVDIQGGVDLPE